MIESSIFPFFQIGGVVPHGGVEKGELLLVVAKMGPAGGRLDHSDEEIRFGGGKEGVGREKLVAQNPDQSHH